MTTLAVAAASVAAVSATRRAPLEKPEGEVGNKADKWLLINCKEREGKRPITKEKYRFACSGGLWPPSFRALRDAAREAGEEVGNKADKWRVINRKECEGKRPITKERAWTVGPSGTGRGNRRVRVTFFAHTRQEVSRRYR